MFNSSDFTIGILRVTFFWNGVKIVSAVLQVGCPLQEKIRITQSIWVTLFGLGFDRRLTVHSSTAFSAGL